MEGCISTPMPNHLSTYRSLPFHHIRVVRMKGKERCGADEKWCGRKEEQIGWMECGGGEVE